MRKMTRWIVGTLIFLIASQAGAIVVVDVVVTETDGSGNLSPAGITNARIGDSITVRLDISNPVITDLTGVFLSVQFDPTVWQYTGGQSPLASILVGTGSLVRFAHPYVPGFDPPGFVRAVSYSQPGSPAATGSEAGIAILTFTAIGYGNSDISIAAQPGDDTFRSGGISYLENVSFGSTLAYVAPDPLPVTTPPGSVGLVALLTSAAALTLWRRRPTIPGRL